MLRAPISHRHVAASHRPPPVHARAAVRVHPTTGSSIGNLDDLLAGEVREANPAVQALGIQPGMTRRAALANL